MTSTRLVLCDFGVSDFWVRTKKVTNDDNCCNLSATARRRKNQEQTITYPNRRRRNTKFGKQKNGTGWLGPGRFFPMCLHSNVNVSQLTRCVSRKICKYFILFFLFSIIIICCHQQQQRFELQSRPEYAGG